MAAWRSAALIAAIVFAAALFGHLTRPLGFLSTFWPANALLMGLMVRNPGWAGPLGWVGAAAGYLAADFAMGGDLGITLWLTAGNLTNACVGYLLFQRIAAADRQLERPQALLSLLLIAFAAAVAAACVSFGCVVVYFGHAPLQAFEFVLTSEFASNLVVLPMVLTASRLAEMMKRPVARPVPHAGRSQTFQPAAALMASILAGTVIGGPTAIAIPIPAILWCALSYGVFPTALLTFGLGLWQCTVLVARLAPGTADYAAALTSHRFGVALFSLGPIMVAVINAARARLLNELDQAANQDALTGVLSRRAFLLRSEAILTGTQAVPGPVALLMLDVDRFKRINDEHGHAAGDEALVALAGHIATLLRPGDLFGRLGGEEFAIMLPGLSQPAAFALAERLRDGCARLRIPVDKRAPLALTISIGLVSGAAGGSLQHLLQEADAALYRAKQAGRDRVVAARLAA
ncbi:diguanylate cyclase [Boseaceae bacterium BT-24-1]|nr:diguanylate cyclase [Boseaceae bacterium BT-24-1]